MRIFIVTFIIFLVSICVAGTANQTNWYGGYGIFGPVTDWANEFYSYTDADWSSVPGELFLRSIVEYSVDENFEANSIYSGDIDGDGDMDVLGTSYWDDEITWWENDDGLGTSWTEHTIDGNFGGAYSVHAEDVDGEGDMDVLGAAGWDDEITWWENVDGSGTSWTEHSIDGNFNGARSVYSEDINGDGYMDALGCASSYGDVTWWENDDGSGTSWTEHKVDSIFGGVVSVYAQDVNGDGDMDLIGAATWMKYVTWWENVDGSGTIWTMHMVDGYQRAYSVYAEDVDGDGDIDILGATGYDIDIIWWENDDGSGTSWTEHTIDWDFSAAVSVYAEDVDGDGDADVLGAAWGDDEITWWENDDGFGTNWTEHTVDGNFKGARSVYAEDVNGDGNLDVLGAADMDNTITWWDLTKFTSKGSLESSCLYLGNDPGWGSIDWTCSTPPGTSVGFQVRASDEPTNMGIWSDTLYSPCSLAGILDEYDSYFQYRILLKTSDSTVTPVIEDVTITWDPVGIEGGADELLLFSISPNPSSGFPVLGFSLQESSSVKFSIFDLSGRIIEVVEENEYSAGYHYVQLEKISSGIYFCRMTAGEFTEAKRFVVIE